VAQRILVVDDDGNNLELARKILQASDYEVVVARDGLEAVAVAGAMQPDLILLDLSLPLLSGWDAVERIRQDVAQAVPIIALTAHAMSGDRERALAAGCTDYLAKPYKPAELRAKIIQHLGAPD
jgi:two-component system cell cycle response regulator DivK